MRMHATGVRDVARPRALIQATVRKPAEPAAPDHREVVTMHSPRQLDELRQGRTELENHHIDELLSGSLSRRQFLRRASVIGISAPLAGAIVAACGGANSSGGTSSTKG